jgi:hypothetical protein
MRRAFAAAALIAVAGGVGFVAAGWSAAPPTPVEKKLIAQVAKLQAADKALTARVTKLEKSQADLVTGVGAAILFGACDAALTADALQGTWQIEDQLSVATQAGKTYYGAQTPVDDTVAGKSACGSLRLTRTQALPPTTGNLAALLLLLHG